VLYLTEKGSIFSHFFGRGKEEKTAPGEGSSLYLFGKGVFLPSEKQEGVCLGLGKKNRRIVASHEGGLSLFEKGDQVRFSCGGGRKKRYGAFVSGGKGGGRKRPPDVRGKGGFSYTEMREGGSGCCSASL